MKILRLFLILFITGVLASIYFYREKIANLPVFELKKIVISDVPHYSFKNLLRIISVKKNTSVFDVDLKEIEKKLLELSWIKDVKVTRVLPDKILVSLKEHEIRGVVLFDMLYFYDNDYRVFLKAYPSEVNEFPLFSGLSLNEYEENFKEFKKKLKIMEKIKSIFHLSELKNICKLYEVRKTLFKGYETLIKCKGNDDDVRIVLGTGDFHSEFNKSYIILNKSKERKEIVNMIIFNELKFKNSVVVKVNEEEEI